MGVAKPDELGLLQMGGRTGIYRIQERTLKSTRMLAQKTQKTQGQKSTLPQQMGGHGASELRNMEDWAPCTSRRACKLR